MYFPYKKILRVIATHFDVPVRQFLNELVGTPILTSVDSFSYGYLKSKVLPTKRTNLEELWKRIVWECRLGAPETLNKVR